MQVLTSSHFWVDAEHVRLVKRGEFAKDGGKNESETRNPGGKSRHTKGKRLLAGLRVHVRVGRRGSGTCSVM